MKKRFLLFFIISLVSFLNLFSCSCWSQPEGSDSGIIIGDEILFDADNYSGLSGKDNQERQIYTWDFGDDTTKIAQGRTATHIYTKTGTYTVTLTMTDLAGNKTRKLINVRIGGEDRKLTPISRTNLILELNLDGSLRNTSDSGLTVKTKSSPAYMQGIQGNCINLKGKNYLTISNNSSKFNNLGQFTISLWAKRNVAGAGGFLVMKNDGTNADDWSAILSLQIRDNGSYLLGRAKTVISNQYTGLNLTASDSTWHHYAYVYDGGTIRVFVDGITSTAAPSTLTGGLKGSDNPIYIGADNAGVNTFDGCIDEIKIYPKALTKSELFDSLSLIHADFHGHTSQYLYFQVPDHITLDTGNKLEVTLNGVTETGSDHWNKKTLNSLKNQEKILLENAKLNTGHYLLKAVLYDSNNDIIDQLQERFYKPYNGIPDVGIDENNAIRIKGELYFPVTSWCLSNLDVGNWVDNFYINGLYGQGFYLQEYTVNGWATYLDIVKSKGVRAIGPADWDGLGYNGNVNGTYHNFRLNSSLAKIEKYITSLKKHDGLFGWMWCDEPDLNYIPATVLRSWTRKSHDLDPQHLVVTTMMGMTWCDRAGWEANRRPFANPYNANVFGKAVSVVDILCFDIYPYEFALPNPTDVTYQTLDGVLHVIRNDTYNLIPVMANVETCDQALTGQIQTPWAPTPEQLTMNIWMYVVHGIKGIEWFPYFMYTPSKNFEAMAKFTKIIKDLTPVVLGPELEKTVTATVTGDPTLDKVETMLRFYNNKYYLFAVRVTEIDPANRIAGSESHTYWDNRTEIINNSVGSKGTLTVTATFSIDGVTPANVRSFKLYNTTDALPAGSIITNTDSGVAVTPAGNSFSCQFGYNDVYIFVIE